MVTGKAIEGQAVNVNRLGMDIGLMSVDAVGDTPLIVHKWNFSRSKREMPFDMPRPKRSPVMEFIDSLYWLDGSGNEIEKPHFSEAVTADTSYADIYSELKKSRFGFPVQAFKRAMVNTGYKQGIIQKITAMGSFAICDEFAVIEGIPDMRKYEVCGAGIKPVRYLAVFEHWKATLKIKYNKLAISEAEIITLLDLAGSLNGIGAWSPCKDGMFGMFHCA